MLNLTVKNKTTTEKVEIDSNLTVGDLKKQLATICIPSYI